MISLTKKSGDKLECLLCPHYCKLAKGKTGICGVRKNTGDKIELITYNILSAYSVDPVEKKPLYHFFPGSNVLSIGSYGCNMRCDFCQNYHISQNIPESIIPEVSVNSIIKDALITDNNIGIAFTYNEPTIWFEYIRDVAKTANKEGLFTVLVSNGYVNCEPLNEMIKFIDAFNIDLKAFNNSFYRNLTGAELEPVKSSLKQIADSGKHLEVTTLIIPGQNDDEKEMALQTEWMANELGPDVPLHLSRYFPNYKRDNPPTSDQLLERLFNIASKNLNYVYLGNTNSHDGQNTSCPVCGTIVTTRSGYKTRLINLDDEGKCNNCGNLIYRNFISSLPKLH
jgi:pyruvate formate lyase activating enzyme